MPGDPQRLSADARYSPAWQLLAVPHAVSAVGPAYAESAAVDAPPVAGRLNAPFVAVAAAYAP